MPLFCTQALRNAPVCSRSFAPNVFFVKYDTTYVQSTKVLYQRPVIVLTVCSIVLCSSVYVYLHFGQRYEPWGPLQTRVGTSYTNNAFMYTLKHCCPCARKFSKCLKNFVHCFFMRKNKIVYIPHIWLRDISTKDSKNGTT